MEQYWGITHIGRFYVAHLTKTIKKGVTSIIFSIRIACGIFVAMWEK